MFHPEAMSVVRAISGQKSATASSFFFFGGNLGFAIGPLLVAWLTHDWGTHAAIWMMIPTLVAFCFLVANTGVISKPAILEFSKRHRDALVPLMNWFRITRRADWGSLADVRRDFAHADIVGRRTVFDIHGNDYRLIARVNYKTGRVFILHILTHQDYSKGDWKR